MGNQLKRQAEQSKLMDIKIKHSSIGLVKFNLFDELKINEAKINSEIQGQPSVYSYLGLLHKKLSRVVKDCQMEYDKLYAKEYLAAKNELNNSTGRANDKETAIQMAIASDTVMNIRKVLATAEEDRDTISVCLKSFEQRAHMIQTLSANVRKIS